MNAPAGHRWGALGADGYYLPVEYAGTRYARLVLVSTRLPCKWVGVVHEYLGSTTSHATGYAAAPSITVYHEGARSRDPRTYQKGARGCLNRRSQRSRRTRSLQAKAWTPANSSRRATHTGGALPWEDEQEEVWCSSTRSAPGQRLGGCRRRKCAVPTSTPMTLPSDAPNRCPACRYHRERDELALAYLFARQAAAIPYPSDRLFIDDAVYRWRSLDELAVAAYWAKIHRGAKAAGATDERRPCARNPSVHVLPPICAAARQAGSRFRSRACPLPSRAAVSRQPCH